MKATMNNKVIADSNDTVYIEGNHYFPPGSVKKEYLSPSDMHTTCPWKGEANYYSITTDNHEEQNAAWYYPKVSDMAKDRVGTDFSNYVAFYKNKVTVQ
jgi:uncharacterized protein (DUF427 family)